jgi:tRNA pseudouridine55 synthase
MNGILLVDKPRDWTSFDVAAKLKGLCGTRRVGHSGTLDPMATGLLVVFLGRATRAVQFAEADGKTYLAALRLGVTTDTQDTSGTVLAEHKVDITNEQLDGALARFRGEIAQVPPMYSALKVNGRKLCDLARKGREVTRAPRPVTISELTRCGTDAAGDILLRVSCSKGTYIRTLCHDVGAALGCGGAMSALRRVRAGAFSVDDAHPLEEILAAAEAGRAEELLLPVETLFAACPALTLSPAQERALRNGVRWTCPLPEQTYRLYGADGAFLAIGAPAEGEMRAIKSFFEVSDP